MTIESKIKIHDISKDGLPDMGRLEGRVAFLFEGSVISGWPLTRPADRAAWEDSENGREFHGVSHWVEFERSILEYQGASGESKARDVVGEPAVEEEFRVGAQEVFHVLPLTEGMDSAGARVDDDGLAAAIREALNSRSVESRSGTPDYVLAAYLLACLDAFESAVGERRNFYDHRNY